MLLCSSTNVSSTIRTQSAPWGSMAPVIILEHWLADKLFWGKAPAAMVSMSCKGLAISDMRQA